MDFEIGKTYRALLQSIEPYKIHVLAVIDDDYIVFKYYGRHKQWWHYDIKHNMLLEGDVERAQKWDESKSA